MRLTALIAGGLSPAQATELAARAAAQRVASGLNESDLYPPGFFASNANWYVRGHFPCGWRGEFPKGQLVIY